MTNFEIRTTTEADVPIILSLIRELAEYERAPDAVVATEAGLREVLFGPEPFRGSVAGVGERGGGRVRGLFLQFLDLAGSARTLPRGSVRQAERSGEKDMDARCAERLAQIAQERGCGRMEWAVLDWNDPAIQFYRKLGAEPMNEWTVFRLTGRGGDREAWLQGTAI